MMSNNTPEAWSELRTTLKNLPAESIQKAIHSQLMSHQSDEVYDFLVRTSHLAVTHQIQETRHPTS